MPARLLADTRQVRMMALMEFFIELMTEKTSQFPRVRICERNFRRRNSFTEGYFNESVVWLSEDADFIIAI